MPASHEKLAYAVKRTAWAYVLIYLDLNLGTIDILPGWLGYWMILSSLEELALYDPSAELLRNLGRFLTCWHVITWVLDIFAFAPSDAAGSIFTLAGIITGVVSIYFHFQLLTNLASICQGLGMEERKERFLFLRTVNTVLHTILSVYSALPFLQSLQWLAIILLIVNFINTLRINICLFGMKGELEEEL